MAFVHVMSLVQAVQSVANTVSEMSGVQPSTIGATSITGLAFVVVVYWSKTMYDNLMHRLDRLEDRIANDINDRHDDLNIKVDAYHETDVKTYERMSMTAGMMGMMNPSSNNSSDRGTREIELIREDVKDIKNDVEYIRKKVKYNHSKTDESQ